VRDVCPSRASISADTIARLRRGDEDALTELYLRFHRAVNSYLLVALRNRDEAEDATQEVFAKVLAAAGRYEQRAEPFDHWLFRIARNHALDCQRRRRHRETRREEDAADLLRVAEARAGEQDDWTFRELIEGLPASHRRVLVLRYVYDFSSVQIGAVLGKTPDAVRHIHMRALRSIEHSLSA
jgi:RNA polymerase sigma-70 factor (ECF subfamily)